MSFTFEDPRTWAIFRNVDFEKAANMFMHNPAEPLLFNSGMFLLLFASFMALYAVLKRFPRGRMVAVIAFSLYFYYKSSGAYCLILLGVCLADYFMGLWMERTNTNWQRRLIVAINVVLNIGMLFAFKYVNMIIDTLASLGGHSFNALNLILPAGISFFTFRSISYIVDLYRRKMAPCKNLMHYVFFLTFFPPLLAGPVVRAKDMLQQLKENPVATKAMTSEGIFLIMSGLIKKIVIADYIGINFVDRIFENPALYSGFENLMGSIGFTLQLYCDFSGYSDLAIGIALLMGYNLGINFDSPFKSSSPTEFWRRWHISLSTWLRDYLYIPLGGNRCGKFRHHFNLWITMVLGGLWHGASWMYVLWGGYQGTLLGVDKVVKQSSLGKLTKKRPQSSHWGGVFLTFMLTVVGMTIFRSVDAEHLQDMATQIFTDFHPEIAMQFARAYAVVLCLIAFGYILHFSPKSWRTKILGVFGAIPILAQALILALILLIAIQTRQAHLIPFVYLQY